MSTPRSPWKTRVQTVGTRPSTQLHPMPTSKFGVIRYRDRTHSNHRAIVPPPLTPVPWLVPLRVNQVSLVTRPSDYHFPET